MDPNLDPEQQVANAEKYFMNMFMAIQSRDLLDILILCAGRDVSSTPAHRASLAIIDAFFADPDYLFLEYPSHKVLEHLDLLVAQREWSDFSVYMAKLCRAGDEDSGNGGAAVHWGDGSGEDDAAPSLSSHGSAAEQARPHEMFGDLLHMAAVRLCAFGVGVQAGVVAGVTVGVAAFVEVFNDADPKSSSSPSH